MEKRQLPAPAKLYNVTYDSKGRRKWAKTVATSIAPEEITKQKQEAVMEIPKPGRV
jgi:aromatic ring-opening dioxygenase catalytic subunit (LigB family)